MIHHLMQTFGLVTLTDFERLALIASLYSACAFAGVLSDLILGDAAFGAVLNGFLLFVFKLTLLVAYDELLQPVRHARPATLLGLCLSGAFVGLFGLAMVKNRIARV